MTPRTVILRLVPAERPVRGAATVEASATSPKASPRSPSVTHEHSPASEQRARVDRRAASSIAGYQ